MNAFCKRETLEAASNQKSFTTTSDDYRAQHDHHVELFHEPTSLDEIITVRFKRCSENRPTEDDFAKSIPIRCPRCQQNHEVVASRLQKMKPVPKRWMFHYLRCRVCDCRFKEPNPDGILTLLLLLAVLIVSPIVIAYCV